MLGLEVDVALGRADVGVPHEVLDLVEVDLVDDEVGRVRVPQRVHVDLDVAVDHAERLRRPLDRAEDGVTRIVVAQRVATITDADQIIVLDEGRVVGRGTHAELLADNQTYREIVDSQLTAEDVA